MRMTTMPIYGPMLDVKFRAVLQDDDNFAIEILLDGNHHSWVKWVELDGPGGGRVCKIDRLEFAWSSSKSQAEQGARELNQYYQDGRIQ